jgi:hypothetical protein
MTASKKVTINNAFETLIKEIKKGQGYKTWKKQFQDWVNTKDRTNDHLKYFLIFDVDQRSFKLRSEYSITHNQIALMEAILPPKRNSDKPIEYKEYKYIEADKE